MSLKLMTGTALFLCAMFVGCGSESAPITSKATNYEVADDSTETTGSAVPASKEVAESAPTNTGQLDIGQVPPQRPKPMNQSQAAVSDASDAVQPTPEQLLTVIRRLRQQEPNGTNESEIIEDFMSLQAQLIGAVDMLLELKPSDDAATEAAAAKIGALTAAAQLGAKGATDQLFAFTEELEGHPSEKVSAFGRQQSFLALLNAYLTDQVTESQPVMDAYKKLAEELPKEGGLLRFGYDVALRLLEKGKNQEAAQLFRHTAGLFESTDDPKLHEAAGQLVEQARLAEVELRSKFNAVFDEEEGASEGLTSVLSELTSGETVGVLTLDTLRQIADQLEPGHGDVASQVYAILEASISKCSDVEMAELLQEKIASYRIRSELVGKPITLEGQLLDGTPFDWNQYKGKVVLVDFWATWCQPCLGEIPNIRANYEKYREHGFEVVGVNINDDMQELKDFSDLQPLPWPSVLSSDPDATGSQHPMATKYGVEMIPFLILVDREGTAVALNTRGAKLGEKLAELFPEAASPSETPAATEPDASAAVTEKPASEKPAAAETESTSPVPPATTPEKTADQPEATPSE